MSMRDSNSWPDPSKARSGYAIVGQVGQGGRQSGGVTTRAAKDVQPLRLDAVEARLL
eukprot:m.50465 g.50465  ORF g.50465 m.50465 type:complete len:57 (+) comp13423_c0_seq16:363-533(+)